MSEYLEGLNTVLKIIDKVTEPTYRERLRLQTEKSKELAEFNKELNLESENKRYERQLLGEQLDAVNSEIDQLEGEWQTLRTSYNSTTGEWEKQEDIYQSLGKNDYETIFNNTTNYKDIETALDAARTKKNALTSINTHLTERINTLGNYSAYKSRFTDYERFTDTGQYIVDPQDIEGAYAESLIHMGYDPRSVPELFPQLGFDSNTNLENYISSPSYDMAKLQDLKTDIPDYLKDYITLNHPSNAQIKSMQIDYTNKMSNFLTDQLNIMEQTKSIDGFLNPDDTVELEKLKKEHTRQVGWLSTEPGVLRVSDIGNEEWSLYHNFVKSNDYALMGEYHDIINTLTGGLPGANWKDYIKPVIPYNQDIYDVDSNNNAQLINSARRDDEDAQLFYGNNMSDDAWREKLSIENTQLIQDSSDSVHPHIGMWLAKNMNNISSYNYYWAMNDNAIAQQWRQENPYSGDLNNIKEMIEYKKKSILETTGDISARFGGNQIFGINMDMAQSALDSKWSNYFDFISVNPLPKLVGYDTWIEANAIHKIDPSSLVLDVVQPWMETINSYKELRTDLENRGIQQNSPEWDREINEFLNNATLVYGGAMSVYGDENLSASHPNKDYYDSTVYPAFTISESDILKVAEEILPIFLNDYDEEYNNYDQLRIAEQVRERFDLISKLEGKSSTYTPKGPSKESLELMKLMKKEGFVGGTTPTTQLNDPINPPASTASTNTNTLPNIGFSTNANNIITNMMQIEPGGSIVNNLLISTEEMDWDSFINSGTFDNGQNYAMSLFSNSNNNKSAMALPVHNVRSSNDYWTIAETYNNDGDKLLYHPSTGPNPVINYRHINDEAYLEDLYQFGGASWRVSTTDGTDEQLRDLLTVNFADMNLFRHSDQYGRGFIPNIAYTHGLISGPNFVNISHDINEEDWIGLADQASFDNEVQFDNDYMNLYAGYSQSAVDRFNDHVSINLFNTDNRDNVFGNWNVSKPSASYDPTLGRYYLNFPTSDRPDMVTEKEFSFMEYDDRIAYLESQYNWGVNQGLLGDSGLGIVTKNDMFIPPVDEREWITPEEAMSANVREAYDEGTYNKVVYLQDPKGGRGHYIDLKVFYEYHLEEAIANDLSVEDVIYEQNGAISGGYYNFDGYAGPVQNLISSNDVYSLDMIREMGINNTTNIFQHVGGINSGKINPIDIGTAGHFEDLILKELNEELTYLGIGVTPNQDRHFDLYNDQVLNALDSLKNTQ